MTLYVLTIPISVMALGPTMGPGTSLCPSGTPAPGSSCCLLLLGRCWGCRPLIAGATAPYHYGHAGGPRHNGHITWVFLIRGWGVGGTLRLWLVRATWSSVLSVPVALLILWSDSAMI